MGQAKKIQAETSISCNSAGHIERAKKFDKCPDCRKPLFTWPKDKCPRCGNYGAGCTCEEKAS